MDHIRIWSEVNIKTISEHIVMVDDISAYCPGCKKIGIPLKDLKKCPQCGREFRYVSSKDAKGGKHTIVSRINKKLPNLTFVDYDDYQRLTSEKNAKSLFNI